MDRPLPEGFASVRVVHAALAVGHEVWSNEVIHGVQVAAGEVISEPALDDPLVLLGGNGLAPLSSSGTGSTRDRLRVALPVVVAPGD